MQISQNDWKPIQESLNLQSFVENYLENGRFVYQLNHRRDESEDGSLINLFDGKIYAVELVRVSNKHIAAKVAKELGLWKISKAREAYKSTDVINTIKSKMDKNYSDLENRILVINADECIPFSWVDKWESVAKFANTAGFHSIYAIQHNNLNTDVLVMKY